MPTRFQPFRKHRSTEGSWGPLIALILLGAFDVGIVSYIVRGVLVFAR